MTDKKDDETSTGRLKLKWLEEPNHERARRSRYQETRVADKLGGRRLPNSGAKFWSKRSKVFSGSTDDGDLATPEFHVEHKRTDNKSMSIKRDWLDKVSEGANRVGKAPALVITFERPAKPNSPPEDWLVIPLEVARRILGYTDDDE